MRKRDPRRVIGRRRQARARVKIVEVPQSEAGPGRQRDHRAGGRGHAAARGAGADLERRVPRAPGAHLLALPHPRVARACCACSTRPTRARSCCSPGRSCCCASSRPSTRPSDDCGTVTWRINRGPAGGAGRPRQGLPADLGVPPDATTTACELVTGRVSSEVANFYPLIGGWGWFSRIGAPPLPDHPAADPRDRDPRLPALAGAAGPGALGGGRAGARRGAPSEVSRPRSAPVISRSFARSWRAVTRAHGARARAHDQRLGGGALRALEVHARAACRRRSRRWRRRTRSRPTPGGRCRAPRRGRSRRRARPGAPRRCAATACR